MASLNALLSAMVLLVVDFTFGDVVSFFAMVGLLSEWVDLPWQITRSALKESLTQLGKRRTDTEGRSKSNSAGELHPCDRVTGSNRSPPVPTERGVRFSRTTLFDR